MSIISRHLLSVTILLLLALSLGVAVGIGVNYFLRRNAEDQLSKSRETLLSELRATRRLPALGDTLTNHCFESLSGDSVWLSDAVHGPTIIAVVVPDCHECTSEMERVANIAEDSLQASRFVFISTVNPRVLSDLNRKQETPLTILYDHLSVWRERNQIDIIPFAIRTDESMIVLEVIAGELLEKEVSAFLNGA